MNMQIPGPGWSLLVQGTVADLYLVPRETESEPIVAKVLREVTPESRRWFTREYRVLSTRVHRGIVPALGGDMEAERPYYFMPFLSGGTLTRVAGTLTPAVLRSVARWLAAAIGALHAQDIAHGDIKPDNVLITKNGTVQVSDPLGNGSGCTITWGAHSGGTPGYWAPEIAAGAPISKAGDVFSLGATLFQLATGISPEDEMCLDPAAHGVTLPLDLRLVLVAMCRSDAATRPTMDQVVATLARPEAQPPTALAAREPESSAWLKLLGITAAAWLGAAALNGTTKSWDRRVGRYRGSDGRFRGSGFFE